MDAYGQKRIATHLMSFFAVEPAWRGPQTLALYWKMIEVIQGTGKPVVTYVQPGLIAERMLCVEFREGRFSNPSLGGLSDLWGSGPAGAGESRGVGCGGGRR